MQACLAAMHPSTLIVSYADVQQYCQRFCAWLPVACGAGHLLKLLGLRYGPAF